MVDCPAECGESGVTTFVVSRNGKVRERAMRKGSPWIGARTTAFDPGAGADWRCSRQVHESMPRCIRRAPQ